MNTTQKCNGFLVLTLVAACFAWRADAAVVDLRAKVRENPSLIHHYTFEGPHQGPSGVATNLSHSGYLLDRKGDLHLKEFASSTAFAVRYGPGADALSRAAAGMQTNSITAGLGAAWYTTNTVVLPTSITLEYVLKPNEEPLTISRYILGVRDAAALERRAYFLYINTANRFGFQIGNPSAVQFYDTLDTNHWYYVATTFEVSANTTTVNAYVADLTAGGALTHAVDNHVVADYYTTNPVRLGINSMINQGNVQYSSPAFLDEVAIYNSVLSAETIAEHLKALRRETPTVWYREIFPNDDSAARSLSPEGWYCHRENTAINTTSPLVENADTAFLEDVPAVDSFPSRTGNARGYVNNYAGVTTNNYIYWTEEMTNKVEFTWLRAVEFDARFNTAQSAHVAVRLDVYGTPTDTSDDAWYMARDFTNAVGTSSIAIPAGGNGPWWRYMLDLHTAEWAVLDFTPGIKLEPDAAQAVPPERALITGFGFFHPTHVYGQNERLDNYTLYVRKIYPPLGTMIKVQ